MEDNEKNLKTIRLLGTWFGLGDIPIAPGTFGTLGGIPIYLGLLFLRRFFRNITLYYSFYFIFIITFFMISVYISDICEEKIFRKKDPSNVVIDEVLGYITTLFLVVPVGGANIAKVMILAFVVFRILDIKKPGPIYKSQEFSNGVGVVLDDFLAGVIGNFVVIGVATVLGWI